MTGWLDTCAVAGPQAWVARSLQWKLTSMDMETWICEGVTALDGVEAEG